MRNKQKGYTLIELVLVVWFLFVIGLVGTGLYVAGHFISKFW